MVLERQSAKPPKQGGGGNERCGSLLYARLRRTIVVTHLSLSLCVCVFRLSLAFSKLLVKDGNATFSFLQVCYTIFQHRSPRDGYV